VDVEVVSVGQRHAKVVVVVAKVDVHHGAQAERLHDGDVDVD